MNIREKIARIADRCGFTESGYLDPGNAVFYPEVRKICQGNTCRNYGSSWACPPAVGTIAECEKRVRQYQYMLLFSKKYELEDSFDFEGMTEGMADFKRSVQQFHEEIRGILTHFLMLSNEGCGRCSRCTYPDAPCRFPQLLQHSLEGYGFIVSELAAQAGIRYHNGTNTVTYFGALLFRES